MEQQQYANGEHNYGFDENARWEILEWTGKSNALVVAKLKNIDDGRIIKMEFDRGNWEWGEGERLDLHGVKLPKDEGTRWWAVD